MRSVGRFLGRLLLLLIVVGAGIWFLGPKEPVERTAVDLPEFADAVAAADYWNARDADLNDVRDGASVPVIWGVEEGVPTDLVFVYLHGFSAAAPETRPLTDRVAEAFGANVIFTRLAGHGRTGEAMAQATAGDWVDDAAEALHVARSLGERIVVIGASTGATLASYVMLEPDIAEDVVAVILISPNYEVVNPAGVLLEWPLARYWVPVIGGAERSFDGHNAQHSANWTQRYPTVATVPMGALLRETRARDYSGVSVPALFMFADTDRVVSASATRGFADGWGGDATLIPVAVSDEGGDPDHHVIAGDILSPALTDRAVEDITNWLREELN